MQLLRMRPGQAGRMRLPVLMGPQMQQERQGQQERQVLRQNPGSGGAGTMWLAWLASRLLASPPSSMQSQVRTAASWQHGMDGEHSMTSDFDGFVSLSMHFMFNIVTPTVFGGCLAGLAAPN